MKSYIEIETEVDYNYIPGEKCVMWGDNAHPGCDAEIEISSVMWRGIDITEKLTNEEISTITTACFEEVAEDNEDRAIYEYESRRDDQITRNEK